MTVKKTQLDEKIQTGGGATGVAHTADPVDKNATLPASHLGNGESMNKIASVTPGQGEEETSSENNTKPTSTAAASNKASVDTKGSAAAPGQSYSFTPNAVREDVEAMFAGSELSEEFKEKATVIFEAAVTAKVNEITEQLEEQYNTALAEETVRIEAELTDGITKYMEYVAEQWLEQNKVAVQASLKSELTENFIADLKNLFEQHYISIPEDKFDAVEAMQEEMAELQQRLDSVMEENMTLKSEVAESARANILADVAEGLAATQAEKLTALAEGVEFDTAENFRKKLEIVKDNYFPTDKPKSNAKALMEEVQEETDQKASAPANSPVSFYAQAISRTVKK
jgi:hypothetical protein